MGRLLIILTFALILQYSILGNSEFIEFPPKFIPSFDPAIPAGHLKPFGYQKPSDGPVIEYNTELHPEELWEKHVKQNEPAVFRQAIAKSSAISRWTDVYLKQHYGDLDVLIELKKENRSFSARRTTLATFIDNYREKDIYVVTVLPDPMRKEIQVPSCLLCGTFVELIHETNFWMSSGGTRSLIHFDADHIIHCLVSGRKDWMLMNQRHVEDLYMEQRSNFSGSGSTKIDPDRVDMLRYPKVANVSWKYTSLYPGDCIFFPSEYIHQVRSYVRSISATMLFTTDDNKFDSKGCDQIDLHANITLDKVHVHWTYKKGDDVIEMGYMNIEMLRNSLFDVMKRMNTDKITLEVFEKFWFHSMDDEYREKDSKDAFRMLDMQGKGFLTIQDVKDLPVDVIKELARAMDPPHGPKKQEQFVDNNLDIRDTKKDEHYDQNYSRDENESTAKLNIMNFDTFKFTAVRHSNHTNKI